MCLLNRRIWLCIGLCLLAGCGGVRADPEARKVADWVIRKGGKLTVDSQTREVKAVNELPVGDFAIIKVDLNGCPLKDNELVHLAGLKNLQILGLYRTGIKDKGLDHIKDLSTLTELELSQTDVTDKGIAKLAGLTKLQKLYIRGTVVTQKAADSLQMQIGRCKIYRQ